MTSQRGRNRKPNPKYAESNPKLSAKSAKKLELQHVEKTQHEKEKEGKPECKIQKLDRSTSKTRKVKEPPKPEYRKGISHMT